MLYRSRYVLQSQEVSRTCVVVVHIPHLRCSWGHRLGDCLLLLRKPAMKWKDYWDCPEEIFIGAMLQFPLYFIIGWKILIIMPLCGLLWRLGGVEGGTKLARRIGVPLIICTITFVMLLKWTIFLAIPFMVWLAPSYGVDSWLYKIIKHAFLTRLICFGWYWFTFSIAYCL